MNITSRLALAIVMTATVAGSAQADGWRGHSHHAPRHRPAQGRDAGWIAPLLVLGIAGAAIGAAAQAPVRVVVPPAMPAPVPVYAAPVYVTPSPTHVQPQAVALPHGLAYYCPSYGQYHPQVQSCPGGWQLVDVAR